MANIKSAIKRIELIRKNTVRNTAIKTGVKTRLRKFVEAENKDEAANAFKQAVTALDKAVAKGVLHKNTAARKKSRLAKRLNNMAQ
ncbi:30S ribosomal protein S20 [Phosphitispora fastidiosa]|uniref:30S ribosomal protein S20 n=1 Tax=Phosphitispora fastidiosa TaxID=2837202 RepID=UPI001E43EFFA|nr:small subunit ribosomal protein S20 [Phosphitispora fastidiosa]